jgi:phosphatidylinositol alpha-1,6-mannosyltransferase
VRVLQINNEYPPLGGGTATVTHETCKRLYVIGKIRSELVTSNGFGIFQTSDDTASGCIITQLPLQQKCLHHASLIDLIRFTLSSLRYLFNRQKLESFDITLAWCTVPAGFIAFVLCKVYGLPYIVRVSGPDIPGFERRYRLIYPILTPILKMIWRSSRCVICKCQEEAERVCKILSDAPIRIIPNGVDIERFYPDVFRSLNQSISILCVARLVERKGQRLAIRALASLRSMGIDAVLTLVGDGDSKEAYSELVISLGLSEFIRFSGSIDRIDMPNIYRNADIFVLPSTAESMSVACLEALASGLPLVLTSGGGSEAFIDQGKNGFLIAAGDEPGFVDAMYLLARDSELRASFGKHSRDIAKRFSWTITTQGIIDALELARLPKD